MGQVTGLVRLLTMVAVTATLTVGCAGQSPEGGTVDEQQATLAARPTIDEITARYERMQAELRRRLVAEVGIAEWIEDSDGNRSGCGDFPDVPTAESRRLGSWYSPGNLPDARWPQAVAVVAEVTGDYGFGPPETVVDRPGDHQIRAVGQYGASYIFGTANNTVLGVSTGCHLPAKVHPDNRQPSDSPAGTGLIRAESSLREPPWPGDRSFHRREARPFGRGHRRPVQHGLGAGRVQTVLGVSPSTNYVR